MPSGRSLSETTSVGPKHRLELMTSFLIDGTVPCCSCGWRSENVYPLTVDAHKEWASHVKRAEAGDERADG